MQIGLATGLCISFLLIANGFAEDNHSPILQEQSRHKPYRSPFRYVIVSNEIINVTGDAEDAFRHITVLLDERSFSEQTLKELFMLVSKRFLQPSRLEIRVYTNLEQIDTPEEKDLGGESELPYDPTTDKYHRALFIRSRDGGELFRYSVSTPVRSLRTVIIKGKDPNDPQR
jgi:hypothetical protein